MEKLKEYVDQGQLEIAKFNSNNQAQKVEYDQIKTSVSRQNKYAHIFQSVQSLDWDEKYEWVTVKRLRANQLYRNGDLDDAIELYLESMIGLDLKDESEGRLERVKRELKFPIMMNIVTCFYKKKEYRKAMEVCEKVLQQEDYLPAVYKKTHLLVEMGNYQRAEDCLKESFRIAKATNNSDYNESLAGIGKILQQKTQKDRKFYEKMFADDESTSLLKEEGEEDEVLIPPSDTWYGKVFDCLRNVLVLNQKPSRKYD